MGRFVALVIGLPLAVIVVVLAVANRQDVTFSLDPFGGAIGLSMTAPLFVFLFGVLLMGIVLGGVGAWLRQGRWRQAARVERANAERLRTDIARLHERIEALQTAGATPPAVRDSEAA